MRPFGFSWRVLRRCRFRENKLPLLKCCDCGGAQVKLRAELLIPLCEMLVENSVEVFQWPDQIRKIRGIGSSPDFKPDVVEPFLATAPISGGQLCFGGKEELQNTIYGLGSESFGASSVFNNGLNAEVVDLLNIDWRETRRAVSQIVRKAWNRKCEREGLKSYELSSGKHCWFRSFDRENGNEVQFIDIDGKKKRRALVGRSEKRGVYWHFAVEAVFDHTAKSLRLKSHVVFTDDGINPVEPSSKQHSLRRGFCRNWWNDRWRTLLQAMLWELACGADEIGLPVSPLQDLKVRSQLKPIVDDDQEFGVIHFDEPKLEFGFGQQVEDPREGLMLFGPKEFERNPKVMRIGVVGTPEGIDLFTKWCIRFKAKTESGTDQIDPRFVPFPGFDATFRAEWPEKPIVSRPIPRGDLLNAIRIRERHQAVAKAVGLFVDQIYTASHEDDADVDIWFVIVPEEVFILGRPKSRVPSEIAIEPSSVFSKRIASRFTHETPSLFIEDNEIARIFDYHADFHHQLKNRLLELKEVTQIFRESSIVQSIAEHLNTDNLADDEEDLIEGATRRMQGPLDVNWNIGTTCFFKAGGRPWKVTTARPGVCYVGLIFKKDERKHGNNHCCGAQLFLESGEGIVFKGALGPWYSKESKQFHLSKEEAKRLIGVVLDTYRQEHGILPSELFIHGRTRFNREELEGFREVAPAETEITGVRITRTSDVKIFTGCDLPVRRGTAILVSERLGYLWTSGYIEHLQTYQGRETPNPLRVEICDETASDIETVLGDIMTLTKMNFNSSVFADGFPVSMRFADAIGDVLMATQDRDIPPLPFRHYI